MNSGLISRASAIKSIANSYDIDNVSAEQTQSTADLNEREPID